MEIRIRQAKPEDAAALLAYGARLINEPDSNVEMSPGEFTHTVSDERVILRDFADSENSVFLVAEVQEEIVGMLSCRGGKRIARRHVADLSMSVRKDFRRRGIGSKLMAAMMEWLSENPVIRRIELHVFARNKHAIHLYNTFGFVEEGCCRKAIYRKEQYLDTLVMAYLVEDDQSEMDTMPVNGC